MSDPTHTIHDSHPPRTCLSALTASSVVAKWRVGTFSMLRQAVLASLAWGGWGVKPAVTISATSAVSAVRKREPTLKALRTLSSSSFTGCIVRFCVVV